MRDRNKMATAAICHESARSAPDGTLNTAGEFIHTEFKIKGIIVEICTGDITLQDTDSIVNAANSSLLGGGGVDGAIHRRGGPQILEECREIRRSRLPEGLPPGEAVLTGGGRLAAKYVVHTVGPVWQGGRKSEKETLSNCYLNSLKLADRNGIASISFPSVSTGAYGFPVGLASETALRAIRDYAQAGSSKLSLIRIVLFSQNDYEIYSRAASRIFSQFSLEK